MENLQTNLVIINCNIRSIRNTIDIFRGLINEHKVDIAYITENWTSDNSPRLMNFGDYKVDGTFSRVDGCYGGAALVVRNGIKLKIAENINNRSVEKQFKMAAIEVPKLNALKMVIYRFPSGDLYVFLRSREEHLDKINSQLEANEINFYFFNVGLNIINEVNPSVEDAMAIFENKVVAHYESMFLRPTTSHEITDVVRGFKNKKASDISGMSTSLLKEVIIFILPKRKRSSKPTD
ncbi:hypothetical protein WA026_022860 [Henosepilachna vigintioctopunctata]|uniref:Uncharacterized protein n=1 Tax=Henosepilachna vigintioctopunctata TaxID=420089 RepID=A0AAW1U6H0_9CUCU